VRVSQKYKRTFFKFGCDSLRRPTTYRELSDPAEVAELVWKQFQNAFRHDLKMVGGASSTRPIRKRTFALPLGVWNHSFWLRFSMDEKVPIVFLFLLFTQHYFIQVQEGSSSNETTLLHGQQIQGKIGFFPRHVISWISPVSFQYSTRTGNLTLEYVYWPWNRFGKIQVCAGVYLGSF